MRNIVSLITLVFLLVSSCQISEHKSDAPYILASTGMLHDVIQHIVGDSIPVQVLMNPGVDPHLYKASLGDLAKIMEAKIVFYNGLHLEGKLSNIFEKQSRIKPVIGLGNYLKNPIKLSADTYDPHIWFDVQNWIDITDIARDSLIQLYPHNRLYFSENAKAYKAELQALHEWVKTRIQTLPPDKRIMVTAHDAFNYFGRAYGIQVRGLQGISTLTDFGLRDVSDLVHFIVENKVPAVFVESSVSAKAIHAVVTGAQSKGQQVRIGGSLYSDAMGAAGTTAGTYIGMVKHNVNTIVSALSANN